MLSGLMPKLKYRPGKRRLKVQPPVLTEKQYRQLLMQRKPVLQGTQIELVL